MREKPTLDESFFDLEAFPISQKDENDISFTRKRNSAHGNSKERILSLLKSACDEYCKQFHDMEADLVRAKTGNKELAEENSQLTEELHKAKEQSCKQFQDMKTELGRAELVNRELDKRNKKLEEEFHRTKGQYCKQILDMENELEIAKSENNELFKKNSKLEEELQWDKEQYYKQVHDTEAKLLRAISENKALAEINSKLEELFNKATENQQSNERNREQTRNKLQDWCTTLAAVKEECEEVCKQQELAGEAPQLSRKRKYVLKVYEINDCVNCPICFEPWAQSGEHNVCSLSCGHFFGRSCITQWIKKTGARGSSRCPLCSSKATLKEIRNHPVSQTYAGDEES